MRERSVSLAITHLRREDTLVPSKGLEPPHRCRYMDLNHARLPIPPRWQSGLQCSGGPQAAESGRSTRLFLQPGHTLPTQPVKPMTARIIDLRGSKAAVPCQGPQPEAATPA